MSMSRSELVVPLSENTGLIVDVDDTVSGVGLSFSCAYLFSAALSILSAIVRRRMVACMGFIWANAASRGRLEVAELNSVVHWSGEAVRRKAAPAGRAAGAAMDRKARREAPVRSMLRYSYQGVESRADSKVEGVDTS